MISLIGSAVILSAGATNAFADDQSKLRTEVSQVVGTPYKWGELLYRVDLIVLVLSCISLISLIWSCHGHQMLRQKQVPQLQRKISNLEIWYSLIQVVLVYLMQGFISVMGNLLILPVARG